MTAAIERHLSPQGLADYLAANVPTVLALKGEPSVTMFIDPPHGRLGLRTPLASAAAPASPLENLELTIISADGVRQLEIVATDKKLFADVYTMLCAVADRIQLDGMAALEAYEATLKTWARLLARRHRLSDDQEIGLFGELLFVRSFIAVIGAEAAISSWRGPAAEEHDFGLSDFDLEIKTTTAEGRRHWITSLTQLVPTTNRPLWFVSVQLTRAGAEHGMPLPALVAMIRDQLEDPVVVDRYRKTLDKLHWRDEQRDLYVQRWQLRSEPAAFLVGETFPAITPNSLAAIGLAQVEIPDVRYQIDVTGRDAEPPPAQLETALEAAT